MTDHREVVSALMDGEADELELRRLLKGGGDEFRATWQRYHRQRDSLHGQPARFDGLDVSGRVMQALAQEPRSRFRVASLARPLSGLAVAAGVAGLVVFGLGDGSLNGARESSSQGVAAESSRVFPSPGGSATGNVQANAPALGNPGLGNFEEREVREQFEHYLRLHNERVTVDSGQGMMFYTHTVSHEAE